MNNLVSLLLVISHNTQAHAGHDEPMKSTRKVPPLEGNEHLFGLDAQVQHKVSHCCKLRCFSFVGFICALNNRTEFNHFQIEFIRRYVPADVKIHLVAHSIGSWIALEMLKVNDISDRIHQCYFLFPTIERMGESPNGRLYRGWLQRFWWLVYLVAVIMSKFPIGLQVLLLRLYFFIWSIPRHLIGTTLKYIRPSILKKIVHMADEEMVRVTEIDLDIVERNKHRIKLYYAASDGWTPLQYFEQLKERIPDIDASVDDQQINHAFVVRSSVETGNKVAEWISKKRVKT